MMMRWILIVALVAGFSFVGTAEARSRVRQPQSPASVAKVTKVAETPVQVASKAVAKVKHHRFRIFRHHRG